MVLFLMSFGTEQEKSKFSELFTEYNRLLLNYAYSYLKNQQDAEDCVADVFEIVANIICTTPEKIGDVSEKRTANYLITITCNKAKNMLKRKDRTANTVYDEDFVQNSVEHEAESMRTVDIIELRNDMFGALSKMDEKYRFPLILYYYHDLTIKEIAIALEISENNVSVLLHRAKEKLRAVIEGGGNHS